eukprot:6117981-Amphidinium_carterae.1
MPALRVLRLVSPSGGDLFPVLAPPISIWSCLIVRFGVAVLLVRCGRPPALQLPTSLRHATCTTLLATPPLLWLSQSFSGHRWPGRSIGPSA